MTGSDTIERPRTGEPGSGLGNAARVIVLNDDHNTFEGVAVALAHVVPGVDVRAGLRFAQKIHVEGRAVVWSGELEVAELYWEQLASLGLTMAPIER